jgi:hypothetical protein
MASKRRIKRQMCVGKLQYKNVNDARRAAGQSSQRLDTWIVEYKCKFCGFYHIGHPPKHVRVARGE